MMTRLKCEIDSARPVAVVRFAGALALLDASGLWHMLTKVLADQPDALVLDLSDVVVKDPPALRTFAALARRAGLWPGVPVILGVPDRSVRLALSRLAIDRQVAVCADLNEALVLANSSPVPPRLRERFQPGPGAARLGRDLATEACLRWHLPALVTPCSMIVSELMTNAVRHAATPFELLLVRTTRFLHVAVRDGDPRPPVRRDAGPLAPDGRGLLIVERTALSWGWSPAQTGKVVWATLAAGLRDTTG
jgi:hypothetical protein